MTTEPRQKFPAGPLAVAATIVTAGALLLSSGPQPVAPRVVARPPPPPKPAVSLSMDSVATNSYTLPTELVRLYVGRSSGAWVTSFTFQPAPVVTITDLDRLSPWVFRVVGLTADGVEGPEWSETNWGLADTRTWSASNAFHLTFATRPGDGWRVDESRDLRAWSAGPTNKASATVGDWSRAQSNGAQYFRLTRWR
jgi:hypothetical protein